VKRRHKELTVKLITALAVSLVTVAVVSAQSQGVVIVQEMTHDGKTTTATTQMDKTHMRVETGSASVFIFDGDAQVARIVDMEKKSYTEMTKADLEKMQQQMAAAMEKVKSMPGGSAMMGKMMGGRGNTTPTTYKAIGSDKAGQWTCSKYEGTKNNEKVSELCTVEPKALGLTPGDFEVAQQLAEFLKAMIPGGMMDQIAVNGTQTQQGFTGVPVKTTTFSKGKPSMVMETKSIKHEAIPASAWQPPAGFKKQTMGGR
jgi:hypothetical protein